MPDNSSNKSATSMADLLAKQKATFVTLHKGDVLEGIVSKLTPQEVLVNINAKTEAVVMEKEKRLMRNLLASLKVGDKVTVSVLNPESDMGYPVVSLRRFMGDSAWEKLSKLQKDHKKLEVTITDTTRGGYVVATAEGVSGFLPFSQMDTQSADQLVGKKLSVSVLELQRATNKVIFSQKDVMTADEFSKAVSAVKTGAKIMVTVTNVTSFGIFAEVPAKDRKLDGLIHISEIAWEKTNDISGMFTPGEQVEVVVIGFDREGKRVDLSIKRLTDNPYEKVFDAFSAEQQVSGTITKMTNMGAELEVVTPDGEKVQAMIRKEKLPPTVEYKEGDEVKATISQIDKKRQRLILVPVLAAKPLGYR